LENKKGELEKEATESKKRNEEKTNEMSSMKHTNQQWEEEKETFQKKLKTLEKETSHVQNQLTKKTQ